MCGVHGRTNGQPVDETAVLHPIAAVAWRPAVEQMVLNAKHVNGIVIRSGVVYGKNGSLTGDWFAGAVNGGELTVVGNGRNRWAMVPIDDLAAGYVTAATSGIKGEAFNFVGAKSAAVDEMAQALIKAAAADNSIRYLPQAEAAQTMGAMAEALAHQQINARKAQERLAWQPQQPDFIEGVETYLAAWQAWQH